MTTLFIHIGTSKTATSTLQVFLKENLRSLAKLEIGVPESVSGGAFSPRPISHHKLAWSITKAEARPPGKAAPVASTLIADLIAEISSRPEQNKQIVTSEAFFSPDCDPTQLKLLSNHMNVKVIVYLRRQDDWLEANYATNIMMPYPSVSSMKKFQSLSYDSLDYASMLARWANVFGEENLIVRPFDKRHLVGGDIVKDFLSALGVTDQTLIGTPTKSYNMRLGAMSLAVLKRLKSSVEEDTFRDIVRLIVRLERIGAIESPRGRFLSLAQRKKLMQKLHTSNESVRRRYLPEIDSELFAEPTADDSFFDEESVSPEDVYNYLSRALLALSRPRQKSLPKEHDVFIE